MADLPPTDRELQALKVLWKRGGATVREIWNLLRVEDANLAYTTVLSLLQVMEQKGLVEHRAGRENICLYAARQTPERVPQSRPRFLGQSIRRRRR